MASTICRFIRFRPSRRDRPKPSAWCFWAFPSWPRGPSPTSGCCGTTGARSLPGAAACRVTFERPLQSAAEIGIYAGNLHRLAREYLRTDRRAKAIENVLLSEVEDAIKRVDEQLDTMDREDAVRSRWSGGASPA